MQAATLPGSEIGVMCFLAAQPELVPAEFDAQWQAQRLRLSVPGLTRYTQLRMRNPERSLGGSPELDMAVDGIEEFWLQDEAAFAAFCEPQTLALLFDSLPLAALTIIRFVEVPIVDGLEPARPIDEMVKRLVVLVRKTGLSHVDFMRHWVEVHQPLARAAATRHSRYHQHHVVEHIANPGALPDHGVRIDGLSESWFRDEAATLSVATTAAGQALIADNRVYVQTSRKLFFVEHELIPHRCE